MALHTPENTLGLKAPDFALKGVDGKIYGLADVRGKNGMLVMFICNHCPYVKAIAGRIADDMKALQREGIGVIAIMPNDTVTHPDDSFDNMKVFARTHQFTFPYVIDDTQETARSYGAVCTPDFFGFDKGGILRYRGRLDEVNPSKPATPDTKKELLDAMTQLANTGSAPQKQTPSMGCSIKWRG